jgi:hypothetical protein
MTLRRTLRFVPLFVPLLLFTLLLMAPYYSGRLSLILHGRPCARVVLKEKIDVFQFVSTDHLRSRGIVFSKGKAIGWVYQPLLGFARFVPFSDKPSFHNASHPQFEDFLSIAWSVRWWLFAVQVLLLCFWFGLRKRAVQYSSY